ncbi:GNAT family N-acetyltransferase [Litchfieldia salsa]|uniref:Predicted N-acyltransferase, GNAT family n=1 Tax=Litchfieldia salsa TaxID=930152 RepID=A0A1H0VJF1_9BACI|nr:GNAT family N-acetyltransferase [Litchfieldia salsa]SDP78647.1 Predicted N-acyltransferase, GNAT family [Litchfieldia salsa]
MTSKIIDNNSDLDLAFSIRKEVFVEEQGVPLELEFDEFDQLNSHSTHILVYFQDLAVGTGRIRYVEGQGKLERICILPHYRQYGLGKLIIQTLEDISIKDDAYKVKLHGQEQAAGFYERLGYHKASDIFIEDGIPHILMKKELSKK